MLPAADARISGLEDETRHFCDEHAYGLKAHHVCPTLRFSAEVNNTFPLDVIRKTMLCKNVNLHVTVESKKHLSNLLKEQGRWRLLAMHASDVKSVLSRCAPALPYIRQLTLENWTLDMPKIHDDGKIADAIGDGVIKLTIIAAPCPA